MATLTPPEDINIARDARERLGMTQMEFAAELGVARRTVIRWEKPGGDWVISKTERMAIANLIKGTRKPKESTL